jgi:peptide/nickel transport system permease protein
MSAPQSESPPIETPEPPRPVRGQSFAAIARRQFLRNRLAVAGLAVVFLFATIAVWCPLLATEKPWYIKTVFASDYENAFFSAIDLMQRCERLAAEPAAAGQTQREYARAHALLLARLKEMEASLGGPARTELETLRRDVVRFSAAQTLAAQAPEEWSRRRGQVEALADPDTAALVPQTLFPAFRGLGPIEVFFLVLWFAVLFLWLSGLWRRGWRWGGAVLLLPALGLAVAWRVVSPPVQDITPYRMLIETPEAPVKYLRAPIPFGENENITAEANQPPTWMLAAEKRTARQHTHWFGTDPNGRDILTRMVYGTRISMLIGIVAVSIYLSIGIVVGAVAGYFRGWIDIGISRLIEIVICFPTLFLLLILLAYMSPNIYTIMAVLGLVSWTGVARLERGEFLRLGNEDFVQAVRALGGSHARIIFRHILPNALGPVLVSASFGIAGAILAESTLSFLGFGVPPDQASWGGLLKDGNDRIQELWWMVVFPGLALFTTVTCFNLVGEGIRDATDPKLMR